MRARKREGVGGIHDALTTRNRRRNQGDGSRQGVVPAQERPMIRFLVLPVRLAMTRRAAKMFSHEESREGFTKRSGGSPHPDTGPQLKRSVAVPLLLKDGHGFEERAAGSARARGYLDRDRTGPASAAASLLMIGAGQW